MQLVSPFHWQVDWPAHPSRLRPAFSIHGSRFSSQPSLAKAWYSNEARCTMSGGLSPANMVNMVVA